MLLQVGLKQVLVQQIFVQTALDLVEQLVGGHLQTLDVELKTCLVLFGRLLHHLFRNLHHALERGDQLVRDARVDDLQHLVVGRELGIFVNLAYVARD